MRAGYDCRNNTTSSATPRSRGVGTPCVAGPLTASLRGHSVSGLLPVGTGGTNEGAATLKPTQGADSKLPGWQPQRESGPNCHSSPRRGTLKSAWGSVCPQRGGAPRTPVHRREGTQGPRCEKLTEWRRGAFGLLQSCCGNCCTIAIVSALEVKFPVSPVSLRDGEIPLDGIILYAVARASRPMATSFP